MHPDLATPAGWLPVVFMVLMGVAMLLYVVLDGYDLGVGILLRGASDEEKDVMVSSIGPFWDANETWLVLGIGILLVAFPRAHGVILTALYLPVALMLTGLILRGVAFDFRVKAQAAHKPWWNRLFWAGSLLALIAAVIVYRNLPHSLAHEGAMHGGVESMEDAAELGLGGVPPIFPDEEFLSNAYGFMEVDEKTRQQYDKDFAKVIGA